MPAASGISQGALNIIRNKVSHMNAQEKLCTLCMDEVSLKTHLFYDLPRDKIVGLKDFGGGYRTNSGNISTCVIGLWYLGDGNNL